MKFAELVESIDLPQTDVAESAWDDGRRRVRRLRGGLAAGAASLAVASVVGIVVLTGGDHHAAPAPGPAPTTSAPTPTGIRTAPVVQRLWLHGRWRSEVADLDFGRIPGSAGPPRLSSDPVARAALALGADANRVLVLGEDGRWRQVDVPGLVWARHARGYTDLSLRPTSMSPDATHLALPQPNALVVVDLAEGTSRRFEVGGRFNINVTWVDDSHVLVDGEGAPSRIVDVRTGLSRPTSYRPWTAFLGDTTLTWRNGPLRWGDGRVVPTVANNAGRGFTTPPQSRDGVVIGVMGVTTGGQGMPFATWGVVAVDGDTGKVLAYLPVSRSKLTDSMVLGWDGDRPVLGLPQPKLANGLFIFTWDWRQGSLDPVGAVDQPDLSWGTGRLP